MDTFYGTCPLCVYKQGLTVPVSARQVPSLRGLNYGNIERFEINQKFAFVTIYFPIQPIIIYLVLGSKHSIQLY